MIIGCCRGNWNLWWTSFSLVGLSFFPWPPVGLSSLGLRPRLYNWPPFGLGKKKSNLGKRSSSLVSFLYRPINVLETEYIFSLLGVCNNLGSTVWSIWVKVGPNFSFSIRILSAKKKVSVHGKTGTSLSQWWTTSTIYTLSDYPKISLGCEFLSEKKLIFFSYCISRTINH